MLLRTAHMQVRGTPASPLLVPPPMHVLFWFGHVQARPEAPLPQKHGTPTVASLPQKAEQLLRLLLVAEQRMEQLVPGASTAEVMLTQVQFKPPGCPTALPVKERLKFPQAQLRPSPALFRLAQAQLPAASLAHEQFKPTTVTLPPHAAVQFEFTPLLLSLDAHAREQERLAGVTGDTTLMQEQFKELGSPAALPFALKFAQAQATPKPKAS